MESLSTMENTFIVNTALLIPTIEDSVSDPRSEGEATWAGEVLDHLTILSQRLLEKVPPSSISLSLRAMRSGTEEDKDAGESSYCFFFLPHEQSS
jgi:hypothetical protein